MKPKVVLTYPFHPETVKKALAPHARVVLARNAAHLKREARTAHALFIQLSDRIDAKFLAGAPHLKVIANYAVGFDNIDLQACQERGISVVNTPDVLSRATAELALTLLLGVARRIVEGEALCRKGKFKGWNPDLLVGFELQDRRALVVGAGRIGRETGRIFQALGMRVEYATRSDTDAVTQEKLARAQVVSLHIPGRSENRHWLSAQRIALLPRDAIVINTARGPLIDEKALIVALKKRRIFGAGLDVFEKEPSIPAALRALPNVLLLPHIGSATDTARRKMAELAISGLLSVLNGKRPPNLVTTVPV